MFEFISGICVNVPTREALFRDVRARLGDHKGFSIATLNLDHVIKLRRDPIFLESYGQHSHITADGNPIVMFSRLARQELELIPGSELIEPVAEIAAELGVKIALFGSTTASLDEAAAALTRKFSNLDVALIHAPPMGFDPVGPDAEAFIEMLRASQARLCFLALGAPKQEVFAAFAQKQIAEVGFFSIGAGLDFISGRQVRAPKLVRKLALEWAWRWAKDPRRLTARYLGCIAVLPRLLVKALKVRVAQSVTKP